MTPARQLGNLIASGDIVMAPGAPDALTARLVERAGFPAVYMTGFGATAVRLGMPDIGLLSQTEMTAHARNMALATRIPIIADADTGYGGPSNIHRTVREYVQAGVAAIHLEDQVAPKRCGQMAGIRLMDMAESGSACAAPWQPAAATSSSSSAAPMPCPRKGWTKRCAAPITTGSAAWTWSSWTASRRSLKSRPSHAPFQGPRWSPSSMATRPRS